MAFLEPGALGLKLGRAGWVIPIAAELGLLGCTGLSTGAAEGLVGCPPRVSLYHQQQNAPRNPPGQGIFASNQYSQHSRLLNSSWPGQLHLRAESALSDGVVWVVCAYDGVFKRRGREQSKNMYEWPMDMDNGVGMAWRSGDWAAQRKAKGENLGQL